MFSNVVVHLLSCRTGRVLYVPTVNDLVCLMKKMNGPFPTWPPPKIAVHHCLPWRCISDAGSLIFSFSLMQETQRQWTHWCRCLIDFKVMFEPSISSCASGGDGLQRLQPVTFSQACSFRAIRWPISILPASYSPSPDPICEQSPQASHWHSAEESEVATCDKGHITDCVFPPSC